jgi:hypothetical protein
MFRRLVRPIIALVALALVATHAEAKIPPMSDDLLEDNANLIVRAEIASVAKDGPIERDHCYGWQPMKATLKVLETKKGDSSGTLVVSYRTRVENTKRCVGGRDSYAFAPGERYTMYLRGGLSASKDGERTFSPINWAGIRREASAPPSPAPEDEEAVPDAPPSPPEPAPIERRAPSKDQ